MPRHCRLFCYFGLALGISWAAWIPYAAGKAGLIAHQLPAEFVWLGEYGPSLAALFLAAWEHGLAGPRNLLSRLLRWRVHPGWYFATILLFPALALLSVTMDRMASGVWPAFAGWEAWPAQYRERISAFAPSLGLVHALVTWMEQGAWATVLVFLTLAITNGGLSEELGWRGYALPALQDGGWKAWSASLLVAFLWTLWHTGPDFWQVVFTSRPPDATSFAAIYVVQYFLLLFPLSIVYSFLWNGTGGGLLLVVLLHAVYNITVNVASSLWPEFPMGYFVLLLWILSMALLAGLGPRRLARPNTRHATDECESRDNPISYSVG